MLGTVNINSRSASSNSVTRKSARLISSETSFIRKSNEEASPPLFLSPAISKLAVFRSALSRSTEVIKERRSVSISRNRARSIKTPRFRPIVSMSSRCERKNPRSSIGKREYPKRRDVRSAGRAGGRQNLEQPIMAAPEELNEPLVAQHLQLLADFVANVTIGRMRRSQFVFSRIKFFKRKIRPAQPAHGGQYIERPTALFRA